jgi:HD-GYP domain-containing protein (c-di-GMP phosphodiesterase class II)
LPAPAAAEKANIKATRFVAKLRSSTRQSWEQGLQALSQADTHLPAGKQFVTLIRAGYHLCHIDSQRALLQSILDDTVAVFDARHGAVLLRDVAAGAFAVEAFSPQPQPPDQAHSQTLTRRCFEQGESFLCSGMLPPEGETPTNGDARTRSTLCALLRSPRRRLGVMYLERGPGQEPFTRDDLQLADALAASISVGVESAQVLEKHREPFLGKAAAFAHRAVQLRDRHAGRHAERVKTYAGWLAEGLDLHPEERKHPEVGALLHDVGRIAVGDLPDGLAGMREQTLKGADLVGALPELTSELPIVRSHHER